MHYLEVTPVIDWKHDAVDLDKTVQRVDIPHTVRSSYIMQVHTVKDVKLESAVKMQERREDHTMRRPVVHKRFVIRTSHDRSEYPVVTRSMLVCMAYATYGKPLF